VNYKNCLRLLLSYLLDFLHIFGKGLHASVPEVRRGLRRQASVTEVLTYSSATIGACDGQAAPAGITSLSSETAPCKRASCVHLQPRRHQHVRRASSACSRNISFERHGACLRTGCVHPQQSVASAAPASSLGPATAVRALPAATLRTKDPPTWPTGVGGSAGQFLGPGLCRHLARYADRNQDPRGR